MAFSSLMKLLRARWLLIAAVAHVHFPAKAMAVIEYDPTGGGSDEGLVFGFGVMAAAFTAIEYSELLKEYAPFIDAMLKWFFRVGFALIALELILKKFGVWVDTGGQGKTLLWVWSIGRMGLACYISGVADSRKK